MIVLDSRLPSYLAAHPYPLLFATVSGAHLYGFPSQDSDYDLRGVHLLPLADVIGLVQPLETIEQTSLRDGLEVDLVTHDARKFFGLLLKKNGYVLEQLYSPLVLQGGPAFEELKAIAAGCITRHHAHHYFGFAETQWKLFAGPKDSSATWAPRVKPLLYVLRVLLTGIHLMRSGRIEANLVVLNEAFRLPYVAELVSRKREGPEKASLPSADLAFYRGEFERLRAVLEAAHQASTLPEAPSAKPALHDLLVRLRLSEIGSLI